MKLTYILVIVMVMAVVAMAAKPDKADRIEARRARKAARVAKRVEMAKCKPATFSYSACTLSNTTTVTETGPAGVEGCGEPVTTEIPCSDTKTITKKNGCILTKTTDFRGCGTGGDPNTLMKTVTISFTNCGKTRDDKTRQIPCSKGVGRRSKTDGKRGGKRKGVECKYSRGSWSNCDAVTNMKTMEQRLKRGKPSQCQPVKIVEKLCKRIKRKSKAGCMYRRGQWSDCDGTTNIKTMVKTLKRGDPNACPPTQVLEKICKRKHIGLRDNCKYKKMGRWGECDLATGVKSREVTLKKGDPEVCAPKTTVTKPCRNRAGGKKGKGKACQYDKNQWGPCDAASNTVSRTLTLKEGDPTLCNVTKVQAKKCKNKHLRPHVCKYRRTTWEECDSTTNMRVMVKTLKRGDSTHCEPTQTVERKCKGKKKTNVCKYKYEEWSECNITTNTMMRQQVLKSGPATCQSVKEYSKKCKKPCKWENGDWSECDLETNQMTRIDTLTKATDPSCPQTRLLTKKCGKKEKGKKCVYDRGIWSDCDISENPERTRTQKLVTGAPNCEAEKITTKSCTKSNGEVRCFFGPWQEYDECRNGVQKKRRQVIQGGLECERKSVKMKAC